MLFYRRMPQSAAPGMGHTVTYIVDRLGVRRSYLYMTHEGTAMSSVVVGVIHTRGRGGSTAQHSTRGGTDMGMHDGNQDPNRVHHRHALTARRDTVGTPHRVLKAPPQNAPWSTACIRVRRSVPKFRSDFRWVGSCLGKGPIGLGRAGHA